MTQLSTSAPSVRSAYNFVPVGCWLANGYIASRLGNSAIVIRPGEIEGT